ncbi:hypothetical protein [Microbacterium aerolatum]|uniref:hypothetical protein n=1 Tax=Microbacterium aerolatum TaxID=153731 RepID=UPI0038506BB7
MAVLIANIDTTGKAISAVEMKKKSEAERDGLRGHLLCPDSNCGAPAYYVRPSRNARHGHFGSRQHDPDCTMRTTDDQDITLGQLREERKVVEDCDLVSIRFDRPTVWTHARKAKGKLPAATVGSSHSRTPGGVSANSRATMGLRRLLAHMAKGSGLGDPGPTIELSDKTKGSANDVIREAKDIAGATPSGRLLVWGSVHSAQIKGSALWINAGGIGSGFPSIRADASLAAVIVDREGLAVISDLRGMWFICEAYPSPKLTGGATLPVSDAAFIAFLPANAT